MTKTLYRKYNIIEIPYPLTFLIIIDVPQNRRFWLCLGLCLSSPSISRTGLAPATCCSPRSQHSSRPQSCPICLLCELCCFSQIIAREKDGAADWAFPEWFHEEVLHSRSNHGHFIEIDGCILARMQANVTMRASPKLPQMDK
jgi:hypothetical protein